ncbi:hypothetical protein DGG96_14595 [Legionella qingyii]|uniref:Uncharacterized protein n=1 Tax=Legionella qingyii TaxID=2184757 RepID=A0A317U3K4_9GAMM|nr:hypothetical protein DGG96_14595 [Legionella qingyii]
MKVIEVVFTFHITRPKVKIKVVQASILRVKIILPESSRVPQEIDGDVAILITVNKVKQRVKNAVYGWFLVSDVG